MGREGKKVHGAGISAQPSKGDGGNLALRSTESETPSPNSQRPGQARHKLRRSNYNGGAAMSQHGA